MNVRLLLLAAYALVIFAGSSIPGDQIGTPAPDYIMHGLEYMVLGFLCAEWLKSTSYAEKLSAFKAALMALAASSLYGASDEIHQYFTPGRFCDPRDWFSDTVGASIGIWLQWIKDKFFENRP